MATLTRKSVRRLFIAVLVALPLQYAIVGVVGYVDGREPWPAILLPGFKNVWDGSDAVRIPRADLEVTMASGLVHPVSMDRLFGDIPASHHLGLLRSQFRPSSLSGTPDTERALAPETRRWLAGRFEEIYPDDHPERLSVIWNEMIYYVDTDVHVIEPIDTLILELNPHATFEIR